MSNVIKQVTIRDVAGGASSTADIGAKAENVVLQDGRTVEDLAEGVLENIIDSPTSENIGGVVQNATKEVENYSLLGQTVKIIPNIASGDFATAEGLSYSVEQSGVTLTAQTEASGMAAHAEGIGTKAEGFGSHAEGNNTISSNGSHAEGSQTTASGAVSHAEGNVTIANGNSAHAEGSDTTAAAIASHAEGRQTLADGNMSHAEGIDTTAAKQSAHTEGYHTLADENSSHAEGAYTSAMGATSHTEGTGTIADELASHAEGWYTGANSTASHAEGWHTTADGKASHASGSYTSAGYDNQTVIGEYNDNKANTLFEVGNGINSANLSNAFEVYDDGTLSTNNGTTRVKLENLAPQVSILPTASSALEGYVYQYIGNTNLNYTHGYFYTCVSDGAVSPTYSWEPIMGTAAAKNYTNRIEPNNNDLIISSSVYGAIQEAVSSIYTPRGSLTCAELTSSLLTSANVGSVYEMSDSGTTSALFIQGPGITISPGDNVGIINGDTTGTNILFNYMGPAFDFTDYQKIDLTTPIVIGGTTQTTVEGALNALNNSGGSTILTQTLAANATSVTFTNIPTTGNYMIDFFIEDGANYTAIDTSVSGQVTLTYEASSSARSVYCRIEEVS